MSPCLLAAREVEDRQPLEEAARVVVEQADLQTGTAVAVISVVAIDRSVKQANLHVPICIEPMIPNL